MSIRDRFDVTDLPPHIGEGGEALIFIDPAKWPGKALKLFLDPDEEGFLGDPRTALEKLQEIQTKLLDFPPNLPGRVIVPLDLAIDPDAPAGRKIAGYYMRHIEGATELQRYAEKPYLDKLNIDYVDNLNKTILPVFRDLHHTVSRLHEHEADIIIGDFTDTNVLVQGSIAYLCDADSFKFGDYPARLGKQDFTDPLLAVKGFSPDTDWYAYTILLLQSLLRVKPYGGKYIPKKAMPLAERIKRRLSIFHTDVHLPAWAMPISSLPANLLEHFEAVFSQDDKRGPFPAYLLDMRWTRCGKCGAVHARTKCPTCHGFNRRPLIKRGEVTATPVFQRDDCRIYAVEYHNRQLRYLYGDNDVYMREDGSELYVISTDGCAYTLRKPNTINNFKILGENTLLWLTIPELPEKRAILCDPQEEFKKLNHDDFRTNSHSMYVFQGTVARFDKYYNEKGTAISKNMLVLLLRAAREKVAPTKGSHEFSVGEEMGLVCVESFGILEPCYIFNAYNMNARSVGELKTLEGSVLDSACYFDAELCWLCASMRKGATITNYCVVIFRNGEIIVMERAAAGSDNWLGTIQGKCARRHSLFTPTKAGIVQVTLRGNRRMQATRHPDTAGFVDAQTRLLRGTAGIYAVKDQEIMLLRWKEMWRYT